MRVTTSKVDYDRATKDPIYGLAFALTEKEFRFLNNGPAKGELPRVNIDIDKQKHVVVKLVGDDERGRKLYRYSSTGNGGRKSPYLYGAGYTRRAELTGWGIKRRFAYNEPRPSIILDTQEQPDGSLRSLQPLPGQFFVPPVVRPEAGSKHFSVSRNDMVRAMQLRLYGRVLEDPTATEAARVEEALRVQADGDQRLLDSIVEQVAPPVRVDFPEACKLSSSGISSKPTPKTSRRVHAGYRAGKIVKKVNELNQLIDETGANLMVISGKLHVSF